MGRLFQLFWIRGGDFQESGDCPFLAFYGQPQSDLSSHRWVCHIVYDSRSEAKASAYNAGDPGSIPGLGRSPGEGNGNPLQYSCLENPKDRGAWWVAACGVAQSQT